MAALVRPMTIDDVDGAGLVQAGAFDDLARREGEQPHPMTDAIRTRVHDRQRHLVEHDPGGAFVATEDGRVVGCALGLRREGLWGLSLLVVDPAAQSGGIGRRLLDAALSYADGCERAVILSSTDPRAMRVYATRGFDLHPQIRATGRPVAEAVPADHPRVRDGGPADAGLADAVDRATRGAGHGPDHQILGAINAMFVVDDAKGQGYVYLREPADLILLAATDDTTATALLWRCLAAGLERDASVSIQDLNAAQQWAIRVACSARLKLAPAGPVFWRGANPPAPYLPSGAYL